MQARRAKSVGILDALARLPKPVKLSIAGAALTGVGIGANPSPALADRPGNPGGCAARIDYVHMSGWAEDHGFRAVKVNATASCDRSVDYLHMRVDLLKLRSWVGVSAQKTTAVHDWNAKYLTNENTWRECTNGKPTEWYGRVTFTGIVDGKRYTSISRSPIQELDCGT